jgi:hypothetical protein
MKKERNSYSFVTELCNMNSFFSFDLFMVYIPECKQQLGTEINTHRYEILHILSLGCNVITLREIIQLYHGDQF